MAWTNLGRVQGAGFFYSSATSATSVALSTITPSSIIPLVGDSVEFSNGDVRVVQSVDDTTITLGEVSTNLMGPQGEQGPQGKPGATGETGPQGEQGERGPQGVPGQSPTFSYSGGVLTITSA